MSCSPNLSQAATIPGSWILRGQLGTGLVANWILHLGPESRQTTEPFHQCCQIRAVPFTHRFELQSQSAAGLHMPHHTIGSNLSLLDKKMKLGRRA
jgi:hypothetical protein